MEVKERNSNFELMRVISMLFIIFWHLFVFGNIRNNPRIQNSTVYMIFDFIQFIIVVHVNSFILVTGYFQCECKFKLNKIFSLINSSLFYKLTIMLFLYLLGIMSFSKVEILQNAFPLILNIYDAYWFIKYYLFLYLISPFLNILINGIERKKYKSLLLILFIIFSVIPYITGTKAFDNNGYTLYQFIFLYLLGAYMKKFPVHKNYYMKRFSKNMYRIILGFIFVFCLIFNYCIVSTSSNLLTYNTIFNEIFGNFVEMKLRYSNPFIIIQSISFFLFFETFDFKSKIINNISKLTFGVYLIHNHPYMRLHLYKWLRVDNGVVTSYKFILYCFFITFVIFIGCSIIEFIRYKIFKFVYDRKISRKLSKKFYDYVYSIKILN